MGNIFYYVVTIKVKFIWKYNRTVSYMEPKNHQEQQKQLADNSTCLHSYSFKINTGKSQGNESVLVSWIREKSFFFRVWPEIFQTDSRRSCCRERSDFNTTQEINHENYNTPVHIEV